MVQHHVDRHFVGYESVADYLLENLLCLQKAVVIVSAPSCTFHVLVSVNKLRWVIVISGNVFFLNQYEHFVQWRFELSSVDFTRR